MKKAFVLTIYNRPDYLKEVLESFRDVRGWKDWHVLFSIDPSVQQDKILALVGPVARWLEEQTDVHIQVNPERYGVLRHPWMVFEQLFNAGYDYVLRSEDDIILGQDVLEYHAWAAKTYKHDEAVGIVTAFSADQQNHDEVHRKIGLGSPLAIGTWERVWRGVIRDTWDHDYSTGTADTRGWDHNIHLRIFPEKGLHAIIPKHTKVEHIGVWGEHSNPSVFWVQPPFNPLIKQQRYREVTA